MRQSLFQTMITVRCILTTQVNLNIVLLKINYGDVGEFTENEAVITLLYSLFEKTRQERYLQNKIKIL